MTPFLGEIRIIAGQLIPKGWAACNGQPMQIAQNTPLFAVLGTAFGGDGIQTFNLPNLVATAPMGTGDGPDLTPRALGDSGGDSTVTLSLDQLASHNHTMQATTRPAATSNPSGVLYGGTLTNSYSSAPPSAELSESLLLPNGGDGAHNNLQPALALTFIIALQGVFPSPG